MASVRSQPLVCVRDVPASSRWYQAVLGAKSAHGGPEYERLTVDGDLVLQLHCFEQDHHHQSLGDPNQLLGNGIAIWFEVDDFDAIVKRSQRARAEVVADVHVNPNAHHRELWLRDPNGYLVVIAGA